MLLDECVDRRLATGIQGHDVKTVPEAGWAGLTNGDLLSGAQHEFDILVTTDRDLPFLERGTPMLRLKAIDHVGLRVSDMDKTLDFYQRLGLTLLRTSGPNADGLRSAVIQVGSQELNFFSHPESVPSAKENHIGMDHFCFLVDATSVDDVIAGLQQARIDIVKGPEQRRDGIALFVHDPDGVRVELQLMKSNTA